MGESDIYELIGVLVVRMREAEIELERRAKKIASLEKVIEEHGSVKDVATFPP